MMRSTKTQNIHPYPLMQCPSHMGISRKVGISHFKKKRDTSISIIFSPWYGAGATGYHDK
jgi:hypothetical protein